ncbi:hypothetical protein BHM03_00005146 [Ensete ventricosum]|nr:hypothetical protein BHM03_00005146 [Ensete ventricosum]
MIAPTKEPKLEDTTLEPKEKDTPQPATRTVPTLAGYTNLQKLNIKGFLMQQSVIILIDTESTHNFMSSKVVAHLMLQKEDYNGFEIKVDNSQILKCNQKCSRKMKAGESTREPNDYNHNTTLGEGTKRRIQWRGKGIILLSVSQELVAAAKRRAKELEAEIKRMRTELESLRSQRGELEKEVGLPRSNLDGARNDRARLEGDVLSLTEAASLLEVKLKVEGQKAVATYKGSRGFESGLEKMRRVNYEFGVPEDANVEMDLDQPFDDGTPSEKQPTP